MQFMVKSVRAFPSCIELLVQCKFTKATWFIQVFEAIFVGFFVGFRIVSQLCYFNNVPGIQA